jgi:hypothetical protein
MHNKRPPPEISRTNICQHVGVSGLITSELHIAEITGVPFAGFAGPWPASMITCRADVPVRTSTITAFAAQVSCNVNMESMFAWR